MSIKHLVSALPIVAQALGDQYGVEVVIGGSQACTNGRTIHLPALPPDDAVATLLARGYLDHESGHIRHTDFGALPPDRTPLLRRLANRLEDIRIEQAMGQRYPGVRTNLNRLVRQLVADGNFQVPAATDHPAIIVCRYVLQRLRAEVLNQEAIAPLAIQTEAVFRQVFSPGVATRLSALLYGAAALQSTQDAVDLAARIVTLLQEEAESPAPPATGQSDQPGSGTGNPQPDNSPDRSDAGTVSDPADALGGNPEPQDDSPAASPATGSGGSTDAHDAQAALNRALGAGEDDVPDDDLGQLLAWRLTAAGDSMPGRRVVVAPTRQCVVRGEPLRWQEAASATARLRRRLTGLVQASRLRCDRIGRRGQQLAPRQLHRLRLGDARVFLQRQERVAVNTAVLLLLDMSGSMRGLPIEIARQTVWAAAAALYDIAGVQVAAGAFPAGGHGVFPLLAFGESPRRVIDRFALAAANTTPLAEALWWAAQRILLRPEPRKLVIVATDGDPDDSIAAQDIIDRLCMAGVEVGGLGMLTMVVRELFPFHTVAATFQEVPEALFRLLQGRLTR